MKSNESTATKKLPPATKAGSTAAPSAEEVTTAVDESAIAADAAPADDTVAADDADSLEHHAAFADTVCQLVKKVQLTQESDGKRTLAHKLQVMQIMHEIGLAIIAEFGEPTSNQPRGQEILKEAAKKFGISASELYRGRQFAARYRDFAQFRKEEPTVASWSAVKRFLPSLTPEGNKTVNSGAVNQRFVKNLKKLLSERATIVNDQFTIADLRDLHNAIAEIVKLKDELPSPTAPAKS